MKATKYFNLSFNDIYHNYNDYYLSQYFNHYILTTVFNNYYYLD